jgi:hypothetical protein
MKEKIAKYIKPAGLIFLPVLLVVIAIFLIIPGDIVAGPQVTTTADDQTSVAITVYNDGTGLIKDTRQIELPRAEFDLIFMDVASMIDPTSVHFVNNTNPDSLAILEQNYEYDLVSTAVLYQAHIDSHIVVQTDDGRTIDGTLLAYDGSLVIQTDTGVNIVNNPVGVTFDDLPQGLITRPTLRWSLISDRELDSECEMSYLTTGLGWSANYVAVVGENDDTLDLSGWVTINNTSGTAYNNAELKLVAGEVHRVPKYDEYADGAIMYDRTAGYGGGAGFQEESFFEYHLYTLQQPATVLNNQQKQLNLLEGAGIDVEKVFIFDPGYDYYSAGDTAQGDIEVRLKFMNSEDNGLGIPIPAGTIRVYKEDSSGSLQFIGEDSVDHTPKDEEIEILMGNAFDIVGERVVKDRREIRYDTWEYDVEVTIRNHKTEDVEIVYWDHVWGDWEVRQSSHEYSQKDASTVEFVVPVESDGETVLTYTIRRSW